MRRVVRSGLMLFERRLQRPLCQQSATAKGETDSPEARPCLRTWADGGLYIWKTDGNWRIALFAGCFLWRGTRSEFPGSGLMARFVVLDLPTDRLIIILADWSRTVVA